jgi:hypoxanthine-guanine phosphoribosyltransferase
MENSPISHEQIYLRLLEVEKKVDEIDQNTRNLVDILKTLEGAFTFLTWLAKAAACVTAIAAALHFWPEK